MRDLNLLNQAWPNAVFGLRPRLFFLLIPCDEPLNKHTAHCQGGAAGGVHITKEGSF